MAYSINTLLSDIASTTHGTTVNKIPGIYGIINRAARALLLDVDAKETQRIVQLSQVFNDVFDYVLPSDVKGDRIIDIRPQAGRNPADVFQQGYAQMFDKNKLIGLSNEIYTQWNTGVKTIRIEAPTLTAPVTVTDTGTLTGWTASTGAQNLSLDQTNNVAGSGAIQFDLANASAVGTIEISTLSTMDLTANLNTSTIFYWVYLPTASAITSLTLRWGSDNTANYYSYTSTATQQGTSFQDGWNLIAAPWISANITGSPVITAIDSVQLIVNYNSILQTGLKFCNLTSNIGYIFEIQYYSKFLFRDSATNAFQETITDSTDNGKIINLDTDSYNLLFNKVAFFTAQALQGADNSYDADYWQTEYDNALKRYRAQNPSEAMKKSEAYYKTPNKGYSKYQPTIWRR
jgi:hypothetical protein